MIEALVLQNLSLGVKVGICELPYAYISSESAGGIGGTCVLRGCVPKKLMVYGSEFANEFKDAVGFGWNLENARHNWKILLENKRKELDRLNGVYIRLLEGSGVDILEGRGKLLDSHTVQVNDRILTVRFYHGFQNYVVLGEIYSHRNGWKSSEIKYSWSRAYHHERRSIGIRNLSKENCDPWRRLYRCRIRWDF